MGLRIDPNSGVGKAIEQALADGSAVETGRVQPTPFDPPAPARPEPGVSEKEFQRRVIELARANGWRVAWFRPVRVQRAGGTVYHETPVGADGKGWPDLVLVRRGDVLFAELKTDTGRCSPEQEAWIDALLAAGLDAGVWRPADWSDIVKTLAWSEA